MTAQLRAQTQTHRRYQHNHTQHNNPARDLSDHPRPTQHSERCPGFLCIHGPRCAVLLFPLSCRCCSEPRPRDIIAFSRAPARPVLHCTALRFVQPGPDPPNFFASFFSLTRFVRLTPHASRLDEPSKPTPTPPTTAKRSQAPLLKSRVVRAVRKARLSATRRGHF